MQQSFDADQYGVVTAAGLVRAQQAKLATEERAFLLLAQPDATVQRLREMQRNGRPRHVYPLA
jgi:hypothetical protein